MSDPATAGAN